MTVSTAARAQDAKAGEKKVQMCIGCHNLPGYQSSFPEIYKVPKIAGQNAKYIVASLNAYKKGERKHPSMRGIAATAVRPGHGRRRRVLRAARQGPPRRRPRSASRRPTSPSCWPRRNCESCHGKNFSTPIDPTYPKLAGQYADYLYAALKAYQTDHNPHVGRSNAIMMGMARPYTHAEIKAMAKYLLRCRAS